MSQRELPKELQELDYFAFEPDEVIEQLVNSFIKEAVPNLYAHYVDNDENKAQLLRTQLITYLEMRLTQQARDILAEVNREIIGEDAQEQYYAGEQAPLHDWKAVTQNELRTKQRTKLSSLRTKYGVED